MRFVSAEYLRASHCALQEPAEGSRAEPGKETVLQHILLTTVNIVLAGKGEMFTRESSSMLQSGQSRVDLELRGNKYIDNCPNDLVLYIQLRRKPKRGGKMQEKKRR